MVRRKSAQMEFLCPLKPRPDWCSNQCKEIDTNDPQKIRLYCFEESLVDHIKGRGLISLSECRKIVEDICSQYRVTDIPEIKDGRGMTVARGGYCSDDILRIKLPCQYRYPLAVLHEATHCVIHFYLKYPKFRPATENKRIRSYYAKDEQSVYEPHGALYVGYVLEIYSSYLKLDLSYLKKVAKQFSLDF